MSAVLAEDYAIDDHVTPTTHFIAMPHEEDDSSERYDAPPIPKATTTTKIKMKSNTSGERSELTGWNTGADTTLEDDEEEEEVAEEPKNIVATKRDSAKQTNNRRGAENAFSDDKTEERKRIDTKENYAESYSQTQNKNDDITGGDSARASSDAAVVGLGTDGEMHEADAPAAAVNAELAKTPRDDVSAEDKLSDDDFEPYHEVNRNSNNNNDNENSSNKYLAANSIRTTRERLSSLSLASSSDTSKEKSSSSDALAKADSVLMMCLMESAPIADLALRRLPVLPESASKIGTHVTHLYLNGNKLKTLPADFFSEMQIMEYLDLRDNQLIEIPAGNPLANHKALKAILLQNNQLTTLPMELGNILTLTTVSFSGNPLTFPPPEVILYGCKAILLYLQECWYSSLLEDRRSISLQGGVNGDGDEEEDEEEEENTAEVRAASVKGRSQTPDVTGSNGNRRSTPDVIDDKRRIKSATPTSAAGRRGSNSRVQHQQHPEVTFAIGQSTMQLQRQKSYGEFKAELFSKLERAGVPVARRPSSRSGSEGGAGGSGGGREKKASRGMGWRPAGPEYDPDAKEPESPEYFARLSKDPKTRLRGTRTTSRRVPREGGGEQPNFPASATSSVRRPTGRRTKEDPTIDLTTVSSKAAADRRKAIEKEKAEKTDKLLQRQRSTAAMQQWRDEEKMKEMKTRFGQRQFGPQHLQQQSLLRRQRAEKAPFEVDPDLRMETKREKMLQDAKAKHLDQLKRGGKEAEVTSEGYERLLAARISEDRNLHRKIHEHKRRIEAQRLRGNGVKNLDTQQHLLDAQQQLAEALELQQQVRQARGSQNTLEMQHGRSFTSKI